ncbi:MAG TPA: hypothetical protein ENM97_04380 [Moorella mulderi]|nr:hypothetical protein [Moorella mulderi]
MSVPSVLREARVWVPLRDFCQLLSWHVFWYRPADTFPAVAGASPFSISSVDEGEIREISRKAANMAMEAFRQTSQNAAEEVLAEKAIYFPDTPGSRNKCIIIRIMSVRLAAHQINGTVLAPGQVFSFNRATGPGTGEKGYIPRVGLKGSWEVGNGVCRTATVLFQVAREAGLEIIERHTHIEGDVDYASHEDDATVEWGRADLRFKNNYPFPVKIYLWAGEGNSLWGRITKMPF